MNVVTIRATHAESKRPAEGLKPIARIFMTTSDFGAEDVEVTEVRPAEYRFRASFPMAGSWAVKFSTVGGEKTFPIQVRN